jgi:RNA polymerase sigma-70 factor, ECF subfamily
LQKQRSRRREVGQQALQNLPETSTNDIAANELTRCATVALGQLNDQDRDALLATFWDRESNVAGATLRKRRERALQRLRHIWRSLYGTE